MDLNRWKFIARDSDASDSECWVFADEPELIGSMWVGGTTMCELASDLGIHESLWPSPGERRRITKFEIVFETEAG